ncbi:hypothetical protein [Corallincola spongiicola]|uniref:PEP-CTERM sorting domain-containing protein n=1 Tax=Corallincola spongiicola TaxID=2520508 RepID=A0ABY1WSF4_9GAMM|nr:hypothetical protein [Corallincola spongiicola]TAA47464.1 hypothetical protein EXY25_09590 [Corallincola spongiicola]
MKTLAKFAITLFISLYGSAVSANFIEFTLEEEIDIEIDRDVIGQETVVGNFYYDIVNTAIVAGTMRIGSDEFLLNTDQGIGSSHFFHGVLWMGGFEIAFSASFVSQTNPTEYFDLEGLDYEIYLPYPCIEFDSCTSNLYDDISAWQDAIANGAILEYAHEGFAKYDAGKSGNFHSGGIVDNAYRMLDELPPEYQAVKVPESSAAYALLWVAGCLMRLRRQSHSAAK